MPPAFADVHAGLAGALPPFQVGADLKLFTAFRNPALTAVVSVGAGLSLLALALLVGGALRLAN